MGMEIRVQPGGAPAETDFCNQLSFLSEYPKLHVVWMGTISWLNFHVQKQGHEPNHWSHYQPKEAYLSYDVSLDFSLHST